MVGSFPPLFVPRVPRRKRRPAGQAELAARRRHVVLDRVDSPVHLPRNLLVRLALRHKPRHRKVLLAQLLLILVPACHLHPGDARDRYDTSYNVCTSLLVPGASFCLSLVTPALDGRAPEPMAGIQRFRTSNPSTLAAGNGIL